ncbi:MAG TPA: DNA gyrase inhibitor YacG [Alphaproteobacteria bacterium]|jgi:endogenous inhibitor of DNA gyrase (YacG/DUF329 family)
MAPYDHDHSGDGARRAAGPLCPICKAPVVERYKPFCSKRCADIDLHRWLAGVYRVPTNEKPEEEEEKK